MAEFDFFYDLGSPYSYLAATQLGGIIARHGATANLLPIALGGVRKELGAQMPSIPQLRYMGEDAHRWAQRYGVPFGIPPSFPTRTIQALRCCVAAGNLGPRQHFTAMQALFTAYWGKQQDLGDPAVLLAALDAAALPGAQLLAQTELPAVKEQLKTNTDLALARGVFGVPTLFIGERSFWGNDRLDFFERALREETKR
jgi:2-hydroxychromene-2-carboxylate isomerase